jgi:hypothetical protein
VVAVPSTAAVEADRSIGYLATQLGQYCNGANGATVTAKG